MSNEAFRQMVSTIFDTTSAELASLVDRGDDDALEVVEEEGIVSFLELRASKERLDEIRGKLQEVVQSLTAVAESATERDEDAGERRYRLTLAYYPLDTTK